MVDLVSGWFNFILILYYLFNVKQYKDRNIIRTQLLLL